VEKPEKEGLVLLIDEIDKADSNLPNGLLELLGNGDIGLPIASVEEEPLRRPLTLITSKDERQLPPAFMRHCLVLTMKLESDGEALLKQLQQFARAHADSKQDAINRVPTGIIEEAAKVIAKLRGRAREGERPPGAAEFLDLLRVVGGLGGNEAEMQQHIQDLHEIVLLKTAVEGD
jgi:MoxR-like ATPase